MRKTKSIVMQKVILKKTRSEWLTATALHWAGLLEARLS